MGQSEVEVEVLADGGLSYLVTGDEEPGEASEAIVRDAGVIADVLAVRVA
jgi:hypothetical protein